MFHDFEHSCKNTFWILPLSPTEIFKGAKNSAAPHDVTFENVFEQASGKLGQKIREKGRVSCPRLVTTERERDRHTIHTRKSTFENLL